jgi:2,5-dihydroxypyridine 5,6-dioxygenase
MTTHELSGLAREILSLSAVKDGERAILLTTHVYDERMVEAFRIALNDLNAEFLRLIVPPRSNADHRFANPLTKYASEVLKTADIVVNIFSYTWWPLPYAPSPAGRIWMHSDEFIQVTNGKTRWLDVSIGEDAMRRLFPTEAMIHRTVNGAKLMAKAKEIRIESSAGTNLTLRKDGRKGHRQIGVVDEEGMWDNYGFGLVACAPLEDSAEGTLVMQPGDYILQSMMEVKDKVEMTFRNGHVTKIEGGLSAKILEKWLAQWKHPDSYAPAHIGWGTHLEGAVWVGNREFTVADAESYPGNMQLALGRNVFNTTNPMTGLGGKNRTPSHLDLQCLNTSFYIDDEIVVKDGQLVNP